MNIDIFADFVVEHSKEIDNILPITKQEKKACKLIKKLPINEKKESKAIRVPGELADLLKEIGDLAKENPDRMEQLKSQCAAIIEIYR